MKAILGKKIGMTQIFDEKGNVIPVTVVEAGPCNVVMKKTIENDGYEAVQIGFGDLKASKVNKPGQSFNSFVGRSDYVDKPFVCPHFELLTAVLIFMNGT